MTEVIAGVTIPDTELVREATSIVRKATDDTLFNHSRRVFLWGSLKAAAQGLDVDPELAYVGGMFHDLGLTKEYGTTHQRFEIDGADLARKLLLDFGRSEQDATNVWLAIALHTTPEVPHHLPPEVAVVILGVETDVIGLGLDEIGEQQRAEVVAAHPRPDFKSRILQAFNDGMADRPDTTFGTMNDDVLAHFDPSFERTNLVDLIQGNAWPE
ncbi:HD domain-containing protein [Mycolicibacterium sp. CBMA 226]|uniref:HD domain-containing protein n=1 Tax=Mycolicibacterium sp. CBMA 226 TaxID=2606611 RepID=UPI0012DC2081|nr:HD domain-containing protein [Mycolicibacterium sp. CBMA 226]MUL76940.1 HD domain-containing protein [Mycolicibacterium sp. CBMA 226]